MCIYIYIYVLESSRALDSLTTHDYGHDPLDICWRQAGHLPEIYTCFTTLATLVMRKLREHRHKEPMEKLDTSYSP